MADTDLRKLSRRELLNMMITFSEEAEAAKKHEEELKAELQEERLKMQHEMAEERAAMLKNFDEERAEMRRKFNEQKSELQAKFDKDIKGLKARLEREKEEIRHEVDYQLSQIKHAGSLAEACFALTGIMKDAELSIEIYKQKLREQVEAEVKEVKALVADSREKAKEIIREAELEAQKIRDNDA